MSGSATHRRKKHGGHEEEHENAERWLLTYADMITLLMVLFIVLFAVSQVDQRKFAQLHNGLATAFEHAQPVSQGGSGILDGGRAVGTTTNGLDTNNPAVLSTPTQLVTTAALQAQQASLQKQLEKALADHGLKDAVVFRSEDRGLVVSILTDKVLFDVGDDTLRADGKKVIDVLTPVIKGLPNDISVEGHTDSTPVSTGRFPSNWDLSVARATSVLRALLAAGVPAKRMAAAGYADTRPIAPDTPSQRSRNRRVEIVILTAPSSSSTTDAQTVADPALPSLNPIGKGSISGATAGR